MTFTERGDGRWHEVHYTPEQEAEALARADAALAEAEYLRRQRERQQALADLQDALLAPIHKVLRWLRGR